MKRKIRLIFGQSMCDGAYTGWQELRTIDIEVDLPSKPYGISIDAWQLLGGQWLEGEEE